MSRVEKLINASQSNSVKFLEFIKIIAKEKLPVIFEGKDEYYYTSRLNNFLERKWIGIDCGGKSRVLELRKEIQSNTTYANKKCLYFVDADFDDNSGLLEYSDVYITPCYSIENLYISDIAFSNILSAEFGVKETTEPCFENLMNNYRNLKKQYLEAISSFNYTIRELRLMENQGTLNTRLNINNLNFKQLIKVKLTNIEIAYDTARPEALFKELPSKITLVQSNSETFFQEKDKELWFRGKQNLEFLNQLLIKLKEDAVKKNDRNLFKNKCTVTLQFSNPLSELSQYAETPDCLVEFLKQVA